jgi:uncharacterized protein (TIGR00725 family)
MGAYVAVVGPGEDATLQDEHDAHRAGLRLGGEQIVVVTGGLAGVMAAAAAGAAEVGACSVGLLPSADRSDGHPSHRLLLPTGLGEMRNALVVRSADVVLAIGGSWGTLSEISLAVRTGVPVVALRCWDLPGGHIRHAPDIDGALDTVLELLGVPQAP